MEALIVEILADKTKTSPFMRLANSSIRPFRSLKQTIYSTLNTFCRQCSEESPGYGLKVSFPKSLITEKITGLFNKSELHSMLQSSDFNAIDVMSFILGDMASVAFIIPRKCQKL